MLLAACQAAGIFSIVGAAEEKPSWSNEWAATVKAAEQEGQLVVYALSEIGDVFAKGGFQKKFPKIKITIVGGRGTEHVPRVMAERRAGKFLADVADLGNTSPYTLYQNKALDPIDTAFILPEVKEPSSWWQGKQQYIDPEERYILVYVGAPLYLVAYNTAAVKPNELKSYWDLLNPKWKGKLAAFDPRAGGFAATRDRFFYHNPELGADFLKRLFGETDLTLYRRYPQGEDWLGAGKFALCLCRHQSISEAKHQGLPVDLVEPAAFKEGVGVETRAKTLVLMNKAAHPNAAKVFINWFLSREGQLAWLENVLKNNDDQDSLREDIPDDRRNAKARRQPQVKYFLTNKYDLLTVPRPAELVKKSIESAK